MKERMPGIPRTPREILAKTTKFAREKPGSFLTIAYGVSVATIGSAVIAAGPSSLAEIIAGGKIAAGTMIILGGIGSIPVGMYVDERIRDSKKKE